MNIGAYLKRSAKRLVFGPAHPQQCPISLTDPQEEVLVCIEASGVRQEVTSGNFMACGAPFTIGVDLSEAQAASIARCGKPLLQFRSRQTGALLGEIVLRTSSAIDVAGRKLLLFHVTSSRNYCLPATQLWLRRLLYGYQRSKITDSSVPITAHEIDAMAVLYICPRPVVLVSAARGPGRNMFPMNLMGPLGKEHFAFALNARTPACQLVKAAGVLAVTSIPFAQTSVAFSFGKHHKKESIDWGELPFPTAPSKTLELPVPKFAIRVREMVVESNFTLGSHSLFLARILSDERYSFLQECFVVHGIYQCWRQTKLLAEQPRHSWA